MTTESSVVNLRIAEVSDAPELTRLINENLENFSNLRFSEQRTTVEREEKYLLGDFNEGESVLFVIEVDNKIVGTIGLHEIGTQPRAARVGATIFDPAERGHHIGSQAIMQVFEYGFSQLSLDRIYVNLFAENLKARRHYEDMGFVFRELLPKAYLLRGQWHDMVCYDMPKNLWEEKFL